MSIVINANNFPTFFADGAVTEPLFLPPNGTRTKYPIGWRGLGRYTQGSLRIWRSGVKLLPGTDYTEEANGVFFDFAVAPSSVDKITDYVICYVPRAADVLKTQSRNLFMVPNWLNSIGLDECSFIGRNIASRSNATATSAGSTTTAQSAQGVVPWVSLSRDAARNACIAAGGHLTRNREYGNIIRWQIAHDIYPTGNSVSGADGMGVAAAPDPTQAGRTLTGSGPVTWAHNLLAGGILDLVGNCWEYTEGLELRDGVFWVENVNNALVSSGISLDITATSGSAYSALVSGTYADDCLPTKNAGDPIRGADGCWYNKSGSMLLIRGGDWDYGALCGPCAFYVSSPVGWAGDVYCAFRLAFSRSEFDALPNS